MPDGGLLADAVTWTLGLDESSAGYAGALSKQIPIRAPSRPRPMPSCLPPESGGALSLVWTYITIGLDQWGAAISTDSARGRETTGNNRHDSVISDTITTPPAPSGTTATRVHDRYIRRSPYRTSSPVTARPMIIRWISLVPSKMVKIFASRCQRSTG
jgi:hypothetical protein